MPCSTNLDVDPQACVSFTKTRMLFQSRVRKMKYLLGGLDGKEK